MHKDNNINNNLFQPRYVSLFLTMGFLINIGLIIILSLYNKSEIRNFINTASLVVIIQILTGTILIKKIEKNLFSLTSLFFIVSNIFHMGQLFLLNFDIKVPLFEYAIYKVDIYTFKNSILFTFVCHAAFIIGALILYNANKSINYRVIDDHKQKRDLLLLNRVGWTLLLIGIFPKLYIDIKRLNLFLHGAYINTYDVEIPGIIAFMCSLTEVGVLLLLIAYQNNKLKSRIIIIVSLIYQGIIIYTGHRGPSVIFIITMLFYYYRLRGRVNLRFLIILGYMLLIIVNIVGKTRSLLNRQSISWMSLIMDNLGFDIIFELLAEFGGTITTVAYSMMFFPQYASVQFGTNYIISILTLIPNIGSILNLVNEKVNFIQHFPGNYSNFLGGSYIAESYYSFNLLGPLFMLLVGIFVAFISIKIKEALYERVKSI